MPPARYLFHHFEAVWREMFIDSAAWAIVKPSTSMR
jgi:hypothetical protein